MTPSVDVDRLPEWEAFAAAVQARRPETGTWCEAWTGRNIVAHQAGTAEELARVLAAHLEGEPVATRRMTCRSALTLIGPPSSWVPAWVRPPLETDPAARVLLLWGRRPADPRRLCSDAGAATLGRLRELLSGY